MDRLAHGTLLPLPLPRGEAHLWVVHTDRIPSGALLARYAALMNTEERARHERYLFERSRDEFAVTRALVRTVLSRYARVEPEAWAFTANTYGRPEIASPEPGAAPLRFNLSNTTGMVICLVALDREIGCDVEHLLRPNDPTGIAPHFFAAAEVAALQSLPPDRQRRRFFDYWTLKEAYIKARGMGISLPLDQFAFRLEPGEPARIAFDPRLADDPASWQFEQLLAGPEHAIAVALRRLPGEAHLTLVVRETVPLQDEGAAQVQV